MNMTQATHAFVSATTCNTCHEAGLSFYMGAASPALQGRPADHTAGQMVAPNDCSICHTTANWNSTVMPAGHMPNPANQRAAVCHTTAPAELHGDPRRECSLAHRHHQQPMRPVSRRHDAAHLVQQLHAEGCGALALAHPVPGRNELRLLPFLDNYAAGGFGPMNMTQATHAFVATTCDTCHEAGLSFYMGAASPALQGRPADHTAGQMVAPNDCSICHTTANWNSTALPAGHMPNPGNQTCTVCHTGAPSNYATLAANAVLHTGITSGCITCHGAPNATPPVFYLNYTPKDAMLSPVHIPTSTTPCEDCHAVSFTSFSGTTMSCGQAHPHVRGDRQDLRCVPRPTGMAFYGVSNLTTRPNGHHVGQDCSGCHNPNNWDGGAQRGKAS